MENNLLRKVEQWTRLARVVILGNRHSGGQADRRHRGSSMNVVSMNDRILKYGIQSNYGEVEVALRLRMPQALELSGDLGKETSWQSNAIAK